MTSINNKVDDKQVEGTKHSKLEKHDSKGGFREFFFLFLEIIVIVLWGIFAEYEDPNKPTAFNAVYPHF